MGSLGIRLGPDEGENIAARSALTVEHHSGRGTTGRHTLAATHLEVVVVGSGKGPNRGGHYRGASGRLTQESYLPKPCSDTAGARGPGCSICYHTAATAYRYMWVGRPYLCCLTEAS